MVEPVSALRVPVVDRFSSPNEMTPPSSVIVPLFRVILPTWARDDAPSIVKLPVVGEIEPIVVPSIEPPSRSILSLFWVAIVPNPKDALAVESLSTVQSVPSDTIKFPSPCSRLDMVSRFSSESCFVSI